MMMAVVRLQPMFSRIAMIPPFMPRSAMSITWLLQISTLRHVQLMCSRTSRSLQLPRPMSITWMLLFTTFMMMAVVRLLPMFGRIATWRNAYCST